MTIRIRVVGCQRYSFKGELFEKGGPGQPIYYDLEDAKALDLLRKTDDYGRAYFARVEKPVEDPEMVIEEERSGEIEGVKITRRRGRRKANPAIRSAGDTSPLEDESSETQTSSAEDGIEV